jgi:predicted ATPase
VLRGETGNGGRRSAEFAQDLPGSVMADLLTLAPELRPRYPNVPANPPLDPEGERQRLLENLGVFFTALSECAPLLLIMEDVHWADSGTLSSLRYLARHTRSARAMIVATYREVELDEARPFHQVRLNLSREGLATDIRLSRLDREQTGELLAILFDEEITPEFLDGIHKETEGHPFFIEELCKALVESGQLTYEEGRWHRPSMEELGIPQSVRVAIDARVGVLPASAQEIIRLAAVLGREFDFDTLELASERDEHAVIEALEDAERAQLVEEVSAEGGGTYAFAHALIPTTLAEGLRTLRRRRLHRRAAAAIEARRPEQYEALAYHYGQAGEEGNAAHYLQKAGDRARGDLRTPGSDGSVQAGRGDTGRSWGPGTGRSHTDETGAGLPQRLRFRGSAAGARRGLRPVAAGGANAAAHSAVGRAPRPEA